MPADTVPPDVLAWLARSGPPVASVWTRGGATYSVVATALQPDLSVLVVYRGSNGIAHAVPLSDWAGLFKPLPEGK